MSAELPAIDRAEFDRRLVRQLEGAAIPGSGRGALSDALWAYYEVLRQWAPRFALIGPGTAESVVERHLGESLAGVSLLPTYGTLVDVGSGAGFPGLVLAAAKPRLVTVLVEARQRKVAFLRTAARRMGLKVDVRHTRVENPLSTRLPKAIDCLTARAIRFEPAVWSALCEQIAPSGRVLVWSGAQRPPVEGLDLIEDVPLADSRQRRILHYQKSPA